MKNIGKESGLFVSMRFQMSIIMMPAIHINNEDITIGANKLTIVNFWIIDTIKFNMILDGELDDLPEQAFLNVGTIEQAIEKGKKLMEQANN